MVYTAKFSEQKNSRQLNMKLTKTTNNHNIFSHVYLSFENYKQQMYTLQA